MLFWITAVLVLYLVQVCMAAPFRIAQVGIAGWAGSRDNLPPLPPHPARAERAARNMAESLPFFLTAGILTLVFGVDQALGIAGAQLFFYARLLYIGLYMLAVPYLRSLVWIAAFAGIVMMALPLLGGPA